MTETTIWPEDGLRARIAELEAALESHDPPRCPCCGQEVLP